MAEAEPAQYEQRGPVPVSSITLTCPSSATRRFFCLYYVTAIYIVAPRKPSRHPRMVCTDFTSGFRCHGCLERLVRVSTCAREGPKPTPENPASHHYFKYCKISALALLKMVMHARSGGNLEVMGLMLGKVDGETMIIMDSFALPVEGTETRVNAQAAAYEYMAAYIENAKQVGRLENAIGWYHSHPGYGCWLSGIDVSTQMLNQQFQEPFVAVVIDPTRTISAGKVNLGAFRTYPKGYKPPDEGPSEYQTIPLNKIEDFGVHCKQYYALEVSYFKSSLDRKLLELLWNKYWVNTLSSSSLLTNADYTTGQVFDLSEKLEQSEAQLGRGSFMLGLETHDRKSEDKLAKATRDSCKTTIEAIHGLMSQVIKDKLFNQINIS
ncbi:COP9 signalosome complex subunit 5 isoform X1 [Acinonyx jubatus]|uniref:COP9 signalosome complex subunit 5 isoform X1 n=1 Tax=Acinonyx jubatus TaxID=32536 RepID=A0A6J1Y2C2_ACIJB|nr:COP9 signalosome complex subunit 5 isoform X1 [Acinonyx jubatus]